MKRAFATTALLTLVVALFLQSSNGAENTPDPPKQKPPSAIEWTSVTVNTPRLRGFTIDYPKGWTEKPIPNGWGHQFIAPESGGFRPNFHVYWGTKGKELDAWVRDCERKYLKRGPGASKEVERKKTTVAGMPAVLLIHTRDDEVGPITWMSWFFSDPERGHGELKGVCLSGLQIHDYRDIFMEFARRIRLRTP